MGQFEWAWAKKCSNFPVQLHLHTWVISVSVYFWTLLQLWNSLVNQSTLRSLLQENKINKYNQVDLEKVILVLLDFVTYIIHLFMWLNII